MSEPTPSLTDGAEEADRLLLGARLRDGRLRRQLSLRELARRIGVSASLVSQIENGHVRPSVSTLLALAGELDLSLDRVFDVQQANGAISGESLLGELAAGFARGGPAPPTDRSRPAPRRRSTPSPVGAADAAGGGADVQSPLLPINPISAALPLLGASIGGPHLERPGTRAVLELDSGVIWERLTPQPLPGMEFLYVRYGVGASSTPAGKHTRHQGIEFGYVTRGTLHITVGFDELVCQAGSSVTFDGAWPHRLENRGHVPAEAVWLILGRRSLLEPG